MNFLLVKLCLLQRNFISYETRRNKNNAFSYFSKSTDNIIINSYSNIFLNNRDYETYRNNVSIVKRKNLKNNLG